MALYLGDELTRYVSPTLISCAAEEHRKIMRLSTPFLGPLNSDSDDVSVHEQVFQMKQHLLL